MLYFHERGNLNYRGRKGGEITLNEKLQQALNEQVTLEFESGYIYMAMAAHLDHHTYEGFASYLIEQAKEEYDHAMRIYDYLNERGVKVKLGKINEPEHDFGNLLDVFGKALAHEKFMTKKVHELADLATNEKDDATVTFLKWFIDEQVEEEATFESIIDKIKRIENDKNALSEYEQELGKRDYATE